MSYTEFLDRLCNAGIQDQINGYRLKKVLGISDTGLKHWMSGGLPYARNKENHLAIDVQQMICWLVGRNLIHHAGRLYDKFGTSS